jgi:hypothetical protein
MVANQLPFTFGLLLIKEEDETPPQQHTVFQLSWKRGYLAPPSSKARLNPLLQDFGPNGWVTAKFVRGCARG